MLCRVVLVREAARTHSDESGAVHAVGERRQHGEREEAEARARQRADEAQACLPELPRALEVEHAGRAGLLDGLPALLTVGRVERNPVERD